MPASEFTKKATSATIDFWASASNGTSLAAHTGSLVTDVKETATQQGYTRIQTMSDIVQTVDSLIRPVVELATIDDPAIAGSKLALSTKILARAGTVAGAVSFIADTASLRETLLSNAETDAAKQSKFEAWALGGLAFVAGAAALTVAAPALVAVLGVAAISLTVASVIAEENPASLNLPALRTARLAVTDAF